MPYVSKSICLSLMIIIIGSSIFLSNGKEYMTNKEENEVKETIEEKEKEEFLDWSMYNPPIENGYIPSVRQPLFNPYNNRSQAYYNQGWYPNMSMPPQVIGCGGRRQPCLGGTQETIPIVSPPVDISGRNIAQSISLRYRTLIKLGCLAK